MGLLLRLDVDKPFGHHTLWRKVTSKIKEDYFLPDWWKVGYLSHLKELLVYLNAHNIPAHIYHRNCTVPDAETRSLLQAGKHHYGFHAEDTRNIDTFSAELAAFKLASGDINVRSFSKHGSGTYKLGKHHYPPYEPEKYREWSETLKIAYPFGNGIVSKSAGAGLIGNWFPNNFWLERAYRDVQFAQIQDIMEIAQQEDVVVLFHPCNYKSDPQVKDDLQEMVKIARTKGITWKLIDHA